MRWLSVFLASFLVTFVSSSCQRGAQKTAQTTQDTQAITGWCEAVLKEIKPFRWNLDECPTGTFRIEGTSVQGRPLVVWEFGNPKSGNTTLVVSMVHGDENTPLYLSLRLMNWLKLNEKEFADHHVVVAPLVNPDGFFRKVRTRVNSRGVDLNRNLPTEDWRSSALQRWKKYGSNPRRYPGVAPNTEPETAFQIHLLEKYKPAKVLSMHAPLNHMDYDGPSTTTLDRFPKDYVQGCMQLRKEVRATSSGYYAGSLGNYAGIERGIPTLTLELPSAQAEKAVSYWNQFESGIRKVIHFDEHLPGGG